MSKSKLKNIWKPGTLLVSKYDRFPGIYLGTIKIQYDWYHEVFFLNIQETFRYTTIDLTYNWKKIKK